MTCDCRCSAGVFEQTHSNPESLLHQRTESEKESSVRELANARWSASIGEVWQNLETVKAHNAIITKFGSLESGPIGFIVKLTSEGAPQTLKYHEINI